MIPGPAYRNTTRWWYEPPRRQPMAHRLPMAHRERREPDPEREAFLLAFAVLVTGLVALWLLLTVALWWVPG